jgi:ActR/RegA family two-component response regulator
VPGEGFSIDSIVTDLIDEVLRETDHNISATARRLGVTREFLRYRLGAAKTPKP